MERISRILSHQKYREHLKKIEVWEKDRVFCKHDKKHFLDVARIAYILYLEEMSSHDSKYDTKAKVKEFLYAAGLLHDIGRWKEYEEGIEHHLASVQLAEPILKDCSFSPEETEQILSIIKTHRKEVQEEKESLSSIFYRADKLSRECFWCPAEKECNWKKEKKNFRIQG